MSRIRLAAAIASAAIAGGLSIFAHEYRLAGRIQARPVETQAVDVLQRIYLEVKELGAYPGESVIRHDFFLGPADDDSYKREHIDVLIQMVDGAERMKIQITEMKTRPDNPRIQLAGKAKSLSCAISAAGGLAVLRSDYSAREIEDLAPEVLRAVLDKKKLLREFGPRPPDPRA